MTRAQRVILTLMVAISCIGCDQAVKTFARNTLVANEALRVFNDIIHLQYSENHGAMLGIGADLPAEARFWLFTVFAGFALVSILAYTLTSGKLKSVEVLALSLVLGGGLSNLIDRLARGGIVIDFVMIVVGPLRTAIFNLADLLIVIGLAILVVSNLPLFSLPPKPSK